MTEETYVYTYRDFEIWQVMEGPPFKWKAYHPGKDDAQVTFEVWTQPKLLEPIIDNYWKPGEVQAGAFDALKFLGALYALKTLKHGMDTGNLPKIVAKIGKYLSHELIQNPEFMIYAGLGYMGFDNQKGQSLTTQLLGATQTMLAYKLAAGGGQIVGPIAAGYLALQGLDWLGVTDPIIETMKEVVDDVIKAPDWKLQCIECAKKMYGEADPRTVEVRSLVNFRRPLPIIVQYLEDGGFSEVMDCASTKQGYDPRK